MRIFTCFALAMLSQCVLIPLCGQLSYTACEPYSLAGSTASVFDWRISSYTFYMEGETGPVTKSSPFFNPPTPAQENVYHLTATPRDYEPADGWELVLVNFGTPSHKVETPTLVLYNRLNGIMRIFQYAKGNINTYQTAALNIRQYPVPVSGSPFSVESSALGHMSTPMNALDNFSKGVSIDFPNKYNNYQAGSSNRKWLFGEFVTAYDPCSCSHPTSFRVQPSFTEITSVNLKLTGQGTTVPVFTPGEPRSGFSAAISGASNIISVFAQGGKTFKELGEFQNFLNSIGLNIPGLGPIGTAVKTLDLLINNSKAPSIASYDSDFVFEAAGTLTKVDLAD